MSDEAHGIGKSAKTFNFEFDGQTRPMGRSFYRGEGATYMPQRQDMAKPTAIADHILKGWMPPEPFIGPHSNIVSFGSCFAANIGRYLSDLGFDVATQRTGKAYIQRIGDGLVNVHAIAQQFEWAWENRVPEVELWHGWKAEDYGYEEDVRLATKTLFDTADVFILTFGLSEIWYDEPTGEVFWRAVPEDKFDPSRHKFRVATYDETIDRLRRIHDLIRKHRPTATVILSLSPIGLAATFRSVSSFAANAVSKATLRAAIDQLYLERRPADENLHYFPSYEVVMHGFQQPFGPDMRHPGVHVVETNMKAFERYFCTTGMTDEDLQDAVAAALQIDRQLLGALPDEERAIVEELKTRWKSKAAATDVSKELIRNQRSDARNERLAAREKRAADRLERLAARDAKTKL